MKKGEISFSVTILDSLLTYDYYLRENTKSRPSWAKEEPIEKSVYHAFFKNGGTEEICLSREGYDSKAAARMMHIEPIVYEAANWIFNTRKNVSIVSEINSITNVQLKNKEDRRKNYIVFLIIIKEIHVLGMQML